MINSSELRRHIVRIDGAEPAGSVDGDSDRDVILGTGFFVAPGWVLTAAHVAYNRDQVIVVPDTSVSQRIFVATVQARSASPGGAGLWPFPDLCLLRIDEHLDHPCALLDVSGPAGDVDCHTWGFPQDKWAHTNVVRVARTGRPGADPTGSPVTFSFEGVEGNGFLKLKAGQAERGLSGAPLVCPARRAVVGVISATRDLHSPLGAWAAPVSVLLAGGLDELADHSRLIGWENRLAVEADRTIRPYRSWDRVFTTTAVLPRPVPPRCRNLPHAIILRRAHRLGARFALLARLESMPKSEERARGIESYESACRDDCDVFAIPFPYTSPSGGKRVDTLLSRIRQGNQLKKMISQDIGVRTASAFDLGFQVALSPEMVPFLPPAERAKMIRSIADLANQVELSTELTDGVTEFLNSAIDRDAMLNGVFDHNDQVSLWFECKALNDAWMRSMHCTLWRFAKSAAFAAIGQAHKMKREVIDSFLEQARGFGNELGLELPPLFTPTGEKTTDCAMALHYILVEITKPFERQLNDRFGQSALNLLVVCSRLYAWLIWTDQEGGRAIAKIIDDKCEALGIPRPVYCELVDALRSGSDFAEIKALAEQFDAAVTKFLCGEHQ